MKQYACDHVTCSRLTENPKESGWHTLKLRTNGAVRTLHFCSFPCLSSAVSMMQARNSTLAATLGSRGFPMGTKKPITGRRG